MLNLALASQDACQHDERVRTKRALWLTTGALGLALQLTCHPIFQSPVESACVTAEQ